MVPKTKMRLRVLLIRLSSFGDVVFTLPAAKALKSLPGMTLGWAIEEPVAELVSGASYVDAIFPTNTRRWRKAPLARRTRREIGEFISAVRAFAPDVVVDAQGLFKSACATFLVPAGRKIGFGFGTATEFVNCLVTDERVDARHLSHVTDRALALVERLAPGPFPRRADVRHLAGRPDPAVDQWLEARSGAPFALLQPFSSSRSKEWESPHVIAFARSAAEIGLDSVVRWGPGESERAEAIVAESGGIVSLAPRTGPASTARLASRAALFVGADTGPTHLAAAAGTPTVALFGPTDPARFGPVGPNTALASLPAVYNPDGSGESRFRKQQDDLFQAARRLLGYLD